MTERQKTWYGHQATRVKNLPSNCEKNYIILLSTTKKMQRYTIFFITVDALHVLGGFSAHHQELKNCTHSIWYAPLAVAAASLARTRCCVYSS
jgi:hypothetical protein